MSLLATMDRVEKPAVGGLTRMLRDKQDNMRQHETRQDKIPDTWQVRAVRA